MERMRTIFEVIDNDINVIDLTPQRRSIPHRRRRIPRNHEVDIIYELLLLVPDLSFSIIVGEGEQGSAERGLPGRPVDVAVRCTSYRYSH
jgi:hypothetical protein